MVHSSMELIEAKQGLLITPKLVPSQQAFPEVFTGAAPDPVHVIGVVAGVAVLDEQARRLDAVVVTAAGLEPGLLRPRGRNPRVLRCGVIREMGQLAFASAPAREASGTRTGRC